MATGGILGNGFKWAFSASSPVSWTAVTQTMNVDQFFNLEAEEVDITTHSTTSSLRSIMPGLTAPPELQFTLLGDNDQSTSTSHELLRTYQLAGTTLWFRFEIPTNRARTTFRAIELQGYVKTFDRSELPIDGAQKTKVTIKYTGNYAEYNSGASAIV